MGAKRKTPGAKIRKPHYQDLWDVNDKKKQVEELKDKIDKELKKPEQVKKAALIIEEWLKQ